MVGIIQCIKALISPLWSPEGGFQALGRDRTSGPITLDQRQGPMSLPDQEPFTHARACLFTQSNALTLTHPCPCAHTHTRSSDLSQLWFSLRVLSFQSCELPTIGTICLNGSPGSQHSPGAQSRISAQEIAAAGMSECNE